MFNLHNNNDAINITPAVKKNGINSRLKSLRIVGTIGFALQKYPATMKNKGM